jgi:hypothetical protein
MSKSKNESKKPQQNEISEEKELDVKVSEDTVETESPAEENLDDKAEDNTEAEDTEKAVETDNETDPEDSGSEEEPAEEKAEEKPEESEEKPKKKKANNKSESEKFRGLSFAEKCRKDPIIPVTLILAFLAIIVAAIYFYLPNAMTPSMGMTLDQFRERYQQGDVSKTMLEGSGSDITFRTPSYVNPDTEPSILGNNQVITANRAFADFFTGPFKYFHKGGIEGATRKSDGQLAYVRVYVEYDDFNTVWLYSSNTLDALYPELSQYESMDLSMKVMNEFNGDKRFYVKGDYGFRMVAMKKEDATYIVLDCVPKKALNESQIREVIDSAPAATTAASSSAASSETTPSST